MDKTSIEHNGRVPLEVGVGVLIGGEKYDNTITVYVKRDKLPVHGKCSSSNLRVFLKEVPVALEEARGIRIPAVILWWECLECKKGGPFSLRSGSLRLEVI